MSYPKTPNALVFPRLTGGFLQPGSTTYSRWAATG